MRIKNMPTPDAALKEYFEDNSIFASLFNSFLFQKFEYVKPDELSKLDTVYTESIKTKQGIEKVTRYRDIARKSTSNYLMILGIENQDKIHYAMPFRNMLYDALSYAEQTSAINNAEPDKRNWTVDERLSHVEKGTTFTPVLTIVFYTGEKEWDGPKSLYDILDIDDTIKSVLPNQPLHIVDLGHDKNLSFTNKDLEELRKIISDIYAKRMDSNDLVNSKNISLASILVGDKELYTVSTQKGDMIMCEALRERDALIFAAKDAEILAVRDQMEAKDAEILAVRDQMEAKDAEIARLKALLAAK